MFYRAMNCQKWIIYQIQCQIQIHITFLERAHTKFVELNNKLSPLTLHLFLLDKK